MIYGIWRTSHIRLREDDVAGEKGFECWYYGKDIRIDASAPWTFIDINAAHKQAFEAQWARAHITYQVREYSL